MTQPRSFPYLPPTKVLLHLILESQQHFTFSFRSHLIIIPHDHRDTIFMSISLLLDLPMNAAPMMAMTKKKVHTRSGLHPSRKTNHSTKTKSKTTRPLNSFIAYRSKSATSNASSLAYTVQVFIRRSFRHSHKRVFRVSFENFGLRILLRASGPSLRKHIRLYGIRRGRTILPWPTS